jgi:hypothetical protein
MVKGSEGVQAHLDKINVGMFVRAAKFGQSTFSRPMLKGRCSARRRQGLQATAQATAEATI